MLGVEKKILYTEVSGKVGAKEKIKKKQKCPIQIVCEIRYIKRTESKAGSELKARCYV